MPQREHGYHITLYRREPRQMSAVVCLPGGGEEGGFTDIDNITIPQIWDAILSRL